MLTKYFISLIKTSISDIGLERHFVPLRCLHTYKMPTISLLKLVKLPRTATHTISHTEDFRERRV